MKAGTALSRWSSPSALRHAGTLLCISLPFHISFIANSARKRPELKPGKTKKTVFIIGADQYELASERGYRNFWNIYHHPPEREHRHYLLERRDSLLPMDDQKFKGAFYTPLHIVDKAYDQLKATLGANWQKKYIVWDMCAGVGNLEAKHSNLRNVYMSTLDAEDVTIMRSNPAFAGAEIFQYDYLNDDVDDFGQIDCDLSGKLP
jgi:hypothetical protein